MRTHFHAFLRDINRLLVAAAPSEHKLDTVITSWLGESTLLWFDEFHVHDIADALILAALLRIVLARRIRLIFTSNMPPDRLLPDPEFHHRFEATIRLLTEHCLMLPFEGPRDYRRASRGNEPAPAAPHVPHVPPMHDATPEQWLMRFGDTLDTTGERIRIATRTLATLATGTHTLLCRFDALCGEPRSHLDYLDLAERFRVVIVDSVTLGPAVPRHTLQRFVWLVDILYDRQALLAFAQDADFEARVGTRHDVLGVERMWSRISAMRATVARIHGGT